MPFKGVDVRLLVGAEQHQALKQALISFYGKVIYGEGPLTDKFDVLFSNEMISIILLNEVSNL